ncbi:MAG TPA: hypothetical protein VGJ16_07155, partial [Pirellulales bacterium]
MFNAAAIWKSEMINFPNPDFTNDALLEKCAIAPQVGEIITSLGTGNSYEIGTIIGEGNFGVVYSCKDV